MAFNPTFAATPGRPVNIRRDIGAALEPDLPPPAAPPPPSDTRDRLTGAAASIAAGIDPNAPSGLQFIGGVARGFAGVQQYLEAVTGQRTTATAEAEQQKREGRLTEARIGTEAAQADYYRAGAEERRRPEPPRATPTPAADNWEEVRGIPVGQPRLRINRRTGETRDIRDPQGRPLLVQPPPGSGRGTGRTPPPPPSGGRKTRADRWDELVAGGMSASAATAKVNEEHAAGSLDD